MKRSLGPPLPILLVLMLVLVLPGCVKLDFFWIQRFEPVREEVTAKLTSNRPELQECMDVLGAPHRVWESRDGVALSYAWLNKFYWKISVDVYFTSTDADGQTLFSYDQANDGYEGAVLVFDDELRLKYVRHGLLADIARDLKKRPAHIE